MSGFLAAIACGFLGMVLGAAIQRWGDAVRASNHTEPDLYQQFAAKWEGW